ncbi:hypothetical protein [Achromobacter pestifer]|nr:hypothetical protein [Achromobacter pestifer]
MTTTGRPSVYTQKIADEICERLATGESLNSICKSDHMPAESTVRWWVIEDRNGLSARYTQARDIGLDVMADQCIQIADDGQNDSYTDDEGRKRTDFDVIARSKLRFDARRWYLSKLAPKRYGERIAQEITNPDGSLKAMSDSQVAGRLAALIAVAQARQAQEASDEPGADLV